MFKWLIGRAEQRMEKRFLTAVDTLAKQMETKSFHEMEIEKIANSAHHNSRLAQTIRARVESEIRELSALESLDRNSQIALLRSRLAAATGDRQNALARGATSHNDPQWASASVVESWIASKVAACEGAIDEMRMKRIDQLVRSI